jgi:membrane peptidoglycan carboxypeptidase
VLIVVIVLAGGFVAGYAAVSVPDPNALARAETSIVYYADGRTELGRFGPTNRRRVPLQAVPQHVRDAVVAAENRSFSTDNGISPRGIARALWSNLTGQATQGGSTITQQYVKNTYLTQERSWVRKIREFFITLKVDGQLSKDEILAGYLNTIYFGRGAYGVQTAAQAYFGKDVSELTLREGAVLAALIRAPGRYDPAGGPDNARRLAARYHYVLTGMAQMGALPPSYQPGTDPLPRIRPVARTGNRLGGPTGYLLAQVRRELAGQGLTDTEIDLGGLRITTTFQRRAQRAAEQAMAEGWPTEDAARVHAGLAAVEPGTGAVRAMYGGRDYVARQFNDATDAAPQAGSTFKAFTLAEALSAGISLSSRFDGNSPYEIPGDPRPVRNEFDRDYGSSIDLVTATTQSVNTAFVDLVATQLAPADVLASAVDAGIPPDAPGLLPNVRITLGTASIHPIDMADAYATFAAGGVRAPWYTVAEVRRDNGGLLYRANPAPVRVFPADVMADLTYALSQVVTDPSGTGAVARGVGRPVAGKTGTAALRPGTTTSAWFVGYTPQLATSVAFYRGDGTENLDGVGGMSTFFGAGYPAQIWTDFMSRALAGLPVEDFPPPAGVGEVVGVPAAPSPPVTPTAPPSPSMGSPSPTASPTPSAPASSLPATTATSAPPPASPTPTGGPLSPVTVRPGGPLTPPPPRVSTAARGSTPRGVAGSDATG